MTAFAELATFPVKSQDQHFALISFVSPHGPQKSEASGFRLYGAFETMEQAKTHARTVNGVDPVHDVFVVELYKWCAWSPDPTSVSDAVHSDERLNTLLVEHRNAQRVAQSEFQTRLDRAEAAIDNTGLNPAEVKP
jgi:hypothetical protein